MSRFPTLRSAALLVAASAVAAACGSRGPLDIGDVQYPTDDSGANATDATDLVDASAPIDASVPEDVGPDHNGGIIPIDTGIPALNCLACVGQSCGTGLVQCFTNTACRTTLQCVGRTCLAGGGTPNPQCLLGCGQADPQSLLQVFQILQCVTMSCGADCSSVLMGGLGGGGPRDAGGGGSPRDAGPGMFGAQRSKELGGAPSAVACTDTEREVFATWPDVCSPGAGK